MMAVEKLKSERKRFFKSLRLVSVYSLISSFCMLGMPIFMINTYRSIIPSENMSSLVGLFVFAMVMLISMGIFEAARNILLARNAARFESQMAGIVMTGELNRQHDTRLQSLQELGQIKNLISSPAVSNLFDLPTVPLFVFLIFMLHFALGVTLLIGAVVMVGLAIWGGRATAPHLEKAQEEQQKANLSLSQYVRMQEYVRSQGLFREALNDWGRNQRGFLEASLHSTNHTSVHGGIAKSSRMMFQVTLIAVGAVLVIAGEADMIIVFAASMIGGRALAPIDSLVSQWRTLKNGYETYQKFNARLEDLNIPDEHTPLPKPKGDVQVQRVTYVPKPGSPPILRAVHFNLPAGKALAVVGPSGAGKSTLARLLVGYLEPSVGLIRLDGQDLKMWDPIARGHHVGYVPQQVDFFEATIQENIASLRRDDPKEWAVKAAQRAGVHDLIMRMPEGYDTVMSKSGFWPSGGQAQLIALARAFYGDPRFLVLDEPNAALDQSGEATLHAALKQAHKDGITTVIVTQRPSVLPLVDLVLVMQNGGVKDFGPRDQVLSGQSVRSVNSSEAPKQAEGQKTAKTAVATPKAVTKPASKPAPKAETTAEQKPSNPAQQNDQAKEGAGS